MGVARFGVLCVLILTRKGKCAVYLPGTFQSQGLHPYTFQSQGSGVRSGVSRNRINQKSAWASLQFVSKVYNVHVYMLQEGALCFEKGACE